MGIRRTVGRIGVNTALFGLGHRARQWLRPELCILAYHRIIDPLHAYDSENVSASLESFDWQMRYMRSNYDVLSFAELKNALDTNSALPRRCALITFDDGFADNYFNAFPVLRNLGMTALFNVVTSMVGQQEMFWFDRAACLVKRGEKGSRITLGEFNLTLSNSNRMTGTAQLLQFLKDQPDLVRREYLAAIDRQLEHCMPSAVELAPHYPLNWEQILQMSAAGMEFGSHTHTHPILAKLPHRTQIEAELKESRSIIEQQTGRPCITVSYPEGLAYALDSRVIETAAQTGYTFGLTSLRRINTLPLTATHALDRIQIHHSNDQTLFEASVQFPELVV